MTDEVQPEHPPLLSEFKGTIIEIHSGDSFTVLPDTKKPVATRFFLASFRAPNPPNRSDARKPLGL